MLMPQTVGRTLAANFLGRSPDWYKLLIIAFLVVNPVVALAAGTFVAGWLLLAEFIFTLAMALRCYPLQPGGLLAAEAVVIGMTTPAAVYQETEHNFAVILLLIFVVAGIHFLRDMLLFVFSRLLVGVRSKRALALLFLLTAAFLSAFLDALTVTAIIIAVGDGFYGIYHRVISGKNFDHDHDRDDDAQVRVLHREELQNFRAFLRGLIMHGVVGTAIGGVSTMVGEPQNLLIAQEAGWSFMEFAVNVAPVSIPVLIIGVATCLLLESTQLFGFGASLTEPMRSVLADYVRFEAGRRTLSQTCVIWVQAMTALVLIAALAFHLAEVGLIGLLIIVLATAFNGVTEEKQIGHAFEAALPFTALLVVFFAIVAVINDQGLFDPFTKWVLTLEGRLQVVMYFVASGVLSAVSDNVFVGTVYISQAKQALVDGMISREQFDLLAVAINTGTNIPSVATPNGQAAFLFLLTSALAPLIRLSYGRMVWMALPYAVTMTSGALLAVGFLL
jgi:NhaB family Na+:H+ antiporter